MWLCIQVHLWRNMSEMFLFCILHFLWRKHFWFKTTRFWMNKKKILFKAKTWASTWLTIFKSKSVCECQKGILNIWQLFVVNWNYLLQTIKLIFGFTIKGYFQNFQTFMHIQGAKRSREEAFFSATVGRRRILPITNLV